MMVTASHFLAFTWCVGSVCHPLGGGWYPVFSVYWYLILFGWIRCSLYCCMSMRGYIDGVALVLVSFSTDSCCKFRVVLLHNWAMAIRDSLVLLLRCPLFFLSYFLSSRNASSLPGFQCQAFILGLQWIGCSFSWPFSLASPSTLLSPLVRCCFCHVFPLLIFGFSRLFAADTGV